MDIKNFYHLEEELYLLYISMRKKILENEHYKYENLDSYISSSDFKDGFYAGVQIMLSLSLEKDNSDI